MECDASREGIGAILSQEDDEGKRRPISLFSSLLNGAQKNDSASELEAWAIVTASRKWREYLQAASVVEIVTGHNPLQWLRKQSDPRGKFARWVIELESINYHIMYRWGIENLAADHLSRHPVGMDANINDEKEYFVCFVYSMETTEPSEYMKRKQEEDQLVTSAKKQLLHKYVVTDGPLKYIEFKSGKRFIIQRSPTVRPNRYVGTDVRYCS